MSLYRSTEKNGILLVISRNFEQRIINFGMLKLNIKTRQDIPEFLTANLLSIHIIAFDIVWSLNFFFLFAQFLLNTHSVSHQPWKVKIENLKFRTDLGD